MLTEGIYKFIAAPHRQKIVEFLEHYWNNPESQPENVTLWLDEKGIIKLLEEIAKE